jgi:hypothetical protein
VRLMTYHPCVVPNVKYSGALTYPDPLGPSRQPVVVDLYLYLTLVANCSKDQRIVKQKGNSFTTTVL